MTWPAADVHTCMAWMQALLLLCGGVGSACGRQQCSACCCGPLACITPVFTQHAAVTYEGWPSTPYPCFYTTQHAHVAAVPSSHHLRSGLLHAVALSLPPCNCNGVSLASIMPRPLNCRAACVLLVRTTGVDAHQYTVAAACKQTLPA